MMKYMFKGYITCQGRKGLKENRWAIKIFLIECFNNKLWPFKGLWASIFTYRPSRYKIYSMPFG